jgi:hypothetical protein
MIGEGSAADLYDVNVPAMSLELHEWDIHALWLGTDETNVA